MNESLEKIVQEAGTAYSEGRYENARKLYESALLNHPNNGILHANLSAIFLRMGLVEKSLQHSEKSVELCPQWAKAYYRKGESLRIANQPHNALLSFCQGLRIDPNNSQTFKCLTETISNHFPWKSLKELKLDRDVGTILSTLGQEMLAEKRYQESAEILELSLRLNIKSLKLRESVLGSLGASLCGCLQYSNALQFYQLQLEAAEQLGDSESIPNIRENIAIVAEQCGNFMLAALQRTYRIDSGVLNGKNNSIGVLEEKLKIANLYLKMEQPNDVIIILKDCQKLKNLTHSSDEINIEIDTLFGKAYAQKGDYKTALGQLLPISKNRQDLELIVIINRCMLELDDLNSSIEFLNKMTTTVGSMDTVLHCYCLLCQTQISASNLSTALRIAKKVLKLSRPSYSIHESNSYRLLAIIYEHQKDTGSAIVLWKKYLENEQVLIVSERVTALLQLGRLSQNETNNENPEKFYDQAIELLSANEEEENTIDFVKCHSAKYRWNLASFELSKAKFQLEELKKILNSGKHLDSKSRSLIFEDIALFDGKAETSETVLILEQSLTEAQDSDDLYREMQILERIGQSFCEQGKLKYRKKYYLPLKVPPNFPYRIAEKYFCQQLEVARELRNVKTMADAHANVAKLKMSLECFAEACEHSRNALTLYKITTEHEKKLDMLIILSKAEMKRNNYDVAISAVEKAINLSESCASNEKLAKSHRIAADLYRITKRSSKTIKDAVERHVNLLEYEQDIEEQCRSLIEILEFEFDKDSEKCMAILKVLKTRASDYKQRLRIADVCAVSKFMKLKIEGYLVLEKILSEKTTNTKNQGKPENSEKENIFRILKKLGSPFFDTLYFLYFDKLGCPSSSNSSHISSVTTEASLKYFNTFFTEDQSDSYSEIVNAHMSDEWSTVLRLRSRKVPCQNLLFFPTLNTICVLKLLEMNAIWKTNMESSDIPDCKKLEDYYQTQIFDIFFDSLFENILKKFSKPLNPVILLHIEILKNSNFDMLADGIRLVDKIICAAFLDEKELIEMWYSELIEEFQGSKERLEVFEACSEKSLLRYSAIFTAISISSNWDEHSSFRILDVLGLLQNDHFESKMFDSETCEITIMRKMMPNVVTNNEQNAQFNGLKFKKNNIEYVIEVNAITVVFRFSKLMANRFFDVLWFEKPSKPTFYDHILKRFIESFGFAKIVNKSDIHDNSDMVVASEEYDYSNSEKHKYWLTLNERLSENAEKTISCLSFIPNMHDIYNHQKLSIVDGFSYSRTGKCLAECLKKIEKCDILVLDASAFTLYFPTTISLRLLRSGPKFVIIINGKLPSSVMRMFAFSGTERFIFESKEYLMKTIKNLKSANSNFLSTVREDVRLALDGDYYMPITPQIQLERVLNDTGKSIVIQLLNMEKDGTISINDLKNQSRKTEVFEKYEDNQEFRKFVDYIFEDHFFNFKL